MQPLFAKRPMQKAVFFCIHVQITRMKELESNSSWFARFSFDEEAKGGVRIDFCAATWMKQRRHWKTVD